MCCIPRYFTYSAQHTVRCQEDHPQHAGPTSVVRPKDARLPGEAERHQCFAKSADGMMVRPGIQWLTKLNVG